MTHVKRLLLTQSDMSLPNHTTTCPGPACCCSDVEDTTCSVALAAGAGLSGVTYGVVPSIAAMPHTMLLLVLSNQHTLRQHALLLRTHISPGVVLLMLPMPVTHRPLSATICGAAQWVTTVLHASTALLLLSQYAAGVLPPTCKPEATMVVTPAA
jgi:streptolysin S family bacteriocin protoxin